MRRGELSLLKCSDVVAEPDGSIPVVLRPEIQKGANKDEISLYLFFEETKKLLLHYLSKIRPWLQPRCDRLFITDRGHPICESRLYRIVSNHCWNDLKIRTFSGKIPSPHTFRHTFATLNINPLGLCLPLEEIVDRLRQVGYEVARSHYIHSNPYLRKMKHRQYEKKANAYNELDRIPLETLKNWMSTKLKLSSEWIEEFQKQYLHIVLIDEQPGDVVSYIPEEVAWGKVLHLGFSKPALRKHCVEEGKCERTERNKWKYNEQYVLELSQEWIKASEVRKTMHLSKSGFYKREKKKAWKSITIGRMMLLRKTDIL